MAVIEVIGKIEVREARSLLQAALEKIKLSQFAAARVDLENALRVAPEDAVLLSFYGLCLAHSNEVGRGLAVCERAVRHKPDEVIARVNLGKVFRLAGDNQAAYRTFLRAWQANRRHPAPATELARMGIRRPPVLGFLPRSHWCNRHLGRMRYRLERQLAPRAAF